MNICIIGAGQTGRGFLARLFSGQADIHFIDQDAQLVSALQTAGRYTVRYFDGSPAQEISGFTAHPAASPAAAEAAHAADIVLVSVRGENDPAVGAWLVQNGLADKCIVACENAALPAALLGEPLARTAASAAVFCTTTTDGEVDILSESYPHLVVSAGGICPEFARLRGVAVEADFPLLMKRKIYTYNAASGIIAYLGAAMGYESYADAANDPRIDERLDRFYAEINRAISRAYGVDEEEQRVFASFSKAKFQNRAIADSIARNASGPRRKLGATERIIAPALLILKNGGDVSVLAETAAAALRYLGARDICEARAALQECSALPPEHPFAVAALTAFAAMG